VDALACPATLPTIMRASWKRWCRRPPGCAAVASIYLPNGNPPETEKYSYKIKWMDDSSTMYMNALQLEEPLVLSGATSMSFRQSLMPAILAAGWGTRCFSHARGRSSARLCHLGLTDAIRAGSEGPGPFTFWDYQAGAWQKNDGIRIDHMLLSAQAADRLTSAGVDKHVRGWEKPSDHVPVWADLALSA
jgi:exodeoxyribonuclease-3